MNWVILAPGDDTLYGRIDLEQLLLLHACGLPLGLCRSGQCLQPLLFRHLLLVLQMDLLQIIKIPKREGRPLATCTRAVHCLPLISATML